jgi:large subunit ribosomal protein L18
MIDKNEIKQKRRLRRKLRIKKRIHGTSEKPRLVVYRSNLYLYAQIVDDTKGFTLFGSSSKKLGKPCNIKIASTFGDEFGKSAKEKGINAVVFDRNGYLYHGKIKAFADAVRKNGIVF